MKTVTPFRPTAKSLGTYVNSTVSSFPEFSLVPLLFVILAKPVADAFFEINAVKYGYMAALFYTAYIAKCGRSLYTTRERPSTESMLFFLWMIILYFIFLFCITVTFGGNLQEIFKVISPFIFFAIVYFAAGRWMAYALTAGALLIVVGNAVLLPTSFGWVTWGEVNTFKGFYFFKTDLAYSLTFAVLILAVHFRYRGHPVLLALIVVAAIQVVLANSRLNYLTFGVVIAFIAFKGGLRTRAIANIGIMAAALIAVVALTYDADKFLGFNTDNVSAFTQGRDSVWQNILDELPGFSFLDWLFGRGMFGDLLLSMEEASSTGGLAHNAHNEYLHLIYTQGIAGTIFYLFLWFKMYRLAHADATPLWLRGTGAAAIVLIALQAMTAVVSSFATKTWPIVMVLLVIRSISIDDGTPLNGVPSK